MEENYAYNAFSKRTRPSLILYRSQCDPYSKRAAHSSVRSEEEWPASKAINHQSKEDGLEPVRGSYDTIELVLEFRVGNASIGKNFAFQGQLITSNEACFITNLR